MKLTQHAFFIWLFALALLVSPAYNLFLSYDYKSNPDCNTYISIARGEFNDQSLTRRYRVIIPFAAKAFAWPLESVSAKLWPSRVGDDAPLRLGFLFVNLVLMATVGLVIYLTCKAYLISQAGSLLAMIAVLCGGRWGNLFSAIPITDSLYLLVIAASILAIKTHNNRLLALCIIIGPLAKESFIFIAPLIFFFAPMHKWKQLILFVSAGIVAFSIRYFIDMKAGSTLLESLVNDVHHTENIGYALQRIANLRGLGELCTVLGFFTIILMIGFTKGKEGIKSWASCMDPMLWWLIPILFLHAVLSSEVARMLYLGSTVWAVMIGLIWDKHPVFVRVKSYFW